MSGATIQAIGFGLFVPSAVFGLWILVQAFQRSTTEGALVLLVPFYALYFAVAKYDSPLKWVWLFVAVVPPLFAFPLMHHGADIQSEQIAREHAVRVVARPPALADPQAAADARVASCDALASWSVCLEFTNVFAGEVGRQGLERSCRELSEDARLRSDSCPDAARVAACRADGRRISYYESGAQPFDHARAKQDCTNQYRGIVEGSEEDLAERELAERGHGE